MARCRRGQGGCDPEFLYADQRVDWPVRGDLPQELAAHIRHIAPRCQRRPAHPPSDDWAQADRSDRGIGHDRRLHPHPQRNATSRNRAGFEALAAIFGSTGPLEEREWVWEWLLIGWRTSAPSSIEDHLLNEVSIFGVLHSFECIWKFRSNGTIRKCVGRCDRRRINIGFGMLKLPYSFLAELSQRVEVRYFDRDMR